MGTNGMKATTRATAFSAQHIPVSELRERGWSDHQILEWLGEPDQTGKKNKQTVKLYGVTRVVRAEALLGIAGPLPQLDCPTHCVGGHMGTCAPSARRNEGAARHSAAERLRRAR